jgi:hypothetical protein
VEEKNEDRTELVVLTREEGTQRRGAFKTHLVNAAVSVAVDAVPVVQSVAHLK